MTVIVILPVEQEYQQYLEYHHTKSDPFYVHSLE